MITIVRERLRWRKYGEKKNCWRLSIQLRNTERETFLLLNRVIGIFLSSSSSSSLSAHFIARVASHTKIMIGKVNTRGKVGSKIKLHLDEFKWFFLLLSQNKLFQGLRRPAKSLQREEKALGRRRDDEIAEAATFAVDFWWLLFTNRNRNKQKLKSRRRERGGAR